MLTEYFKDLDVDAAVSVDRPVFVNYETSVFYSPSLGGVTSSLNRYVDFNIGVLVLLGVACTLWLLIRSCLPIFICPRRLLV